jgi:chromate transport protein ChrA
MSTPTTQVIIPQDVEKSPPELATLNQVLPTHQSLEAEYDDNSRVPHLSILQIFWLFFSQFGIFAWGGPVAQIALIKERLVVKDQWITMARFIRVFGVYQILPGPEAAELCMFFGCLAGGRWGGLAAGLGFVLPGFVLMLAASYIYVVVGFGNTYFDASFRALQPMVAAMVSTFLCFNGTNVQDPLWTDFACNTQDCGTRSRFTRNQETQRVACLIRPIHST